MKRCLNKYGLFHRWENVSQDFDLTKTCSHGKILQTTRGISMVYLASPTKRAGESKTWSCVAKCNKKANKSDKRSAQNIYKSLNISCTIFRVQNIYLSEQIYIFLLISNQQNKQIFNLQLSLWQCSNWMATFSIKVYRPIFTAANSK